MAFDEGLAELMRTELAHLDGLEEKRMFGGLCFMHEGHMLCGVHKGGAMFRVGKEQQSGALALDGVTPLAFTGRPMGGMVDVSDDAMASDDTRAALMQMSLRFIKSLPPKT